MVTEEYFPRGKTKTDITAADETKSSVSDKKDNRFVNILSEKDGKQSKKKKTKVAKKEKPVLSVKAVPTLGYEQMKEGLIIGGVVAEINDYDVKVSLPSHLVATLPITNISTAYTDALRKAAEEEDDEETVDDVPSLSDLFRVGQFLVVAVVSCEMTGTKHNLTVSIDPKMVMAGRIPGEGDLCVASISSKEDHGYIMDVGNKTVRGFLPNKAAQKHWNKNLCVGMVILCAIVRKDKGAVTLKCEPGKVFNSVHKEPNLHNTLPGTLFRAKVSANVGNGVKVELGKDVDGYLHNDLLPSADSPGDLEVGSDVDVRLVSVLPTVNTVLLTARPVWPFTNAFGDLKGGTLIKEATIAQVHKREIILKLTDTVMGCVAPRNAKEGTEILKNLKEHFKVGETVKARVLGLDHFTGMAVCTMKKSLVSGISHLDQLTVGQKIKATIKRFTEKGLEVAVGGNLTGLIPTLYLSDVPLKHPEKKYFPGDKLECRVLKINQERKQLLLTSKPILVKKEFSVVASYEDAKVGTITEGVVTKITKDGLLLSMFGDMRGFAPRRALSTETIEFPEKLFFIGQAVKCQIFECEKERKRISLSLVLSDMKPLGKKEKQAGKVLELGKIYTGKVTNIAQSGLDVEVVNDGVAARCMIPTNHLTDNISLAATLLHSYRVGDTIEGVCIQHDVVTVLSRKQSIIEIVKSGQLPDSFEKIHEGSILPGYVQTIKQFGVFLKLPVWSLKSSILVPTRNIANFYVEDTKQILDKGQTLMVKVTEKDDEELKLAGTTNFKELVKTGTESVTMMKGILDDLRFMRQQSETLSKVGIGDLMTGTVKETTEMGVILDVNGIVSLAPKSSLAGGQLEAGDRIPVMVVFVDYQAGVLEVSCDTSVITSSAVCNQVPEVGAKVRGKVLMTRTEHNIQLVSITNPPKHSGCLVFVPTVVHINDLVGDQTETADKPVNIIIQHITERDEIIGVNERHQRMSTKKGKRERSSSISTDEANKLKRQRTESESSVTELLAAVKAQETPDFVPPKPILPVKTTPDKSKDQKNMKTDENKSAKSTEKSSKKKDKKKKKNADEDEPMEADETESNDVTMDEPVTSLFNRKDTLEDPGWDYSLTRVTIPSWNKASIWDDSDDEDTKVEGGEAKKHVGKKEAKNLRKEEEKAALEQERKVIEGENQAPTSTQEFEKLVLSSPDSSLVWIQYMAFYLQTCQYDQARAIAARAVERINFREEGERLNVFLAWLNLENSFGNQDSLDKVLRDALQRNDEFKVYSQMADIYTKSSKYDEAEKIYKILAKKFSKDKEVWIRYGLFYYKNSRLEDGRFVFTRSLQNLEPKDSVDISAKFAQIEFRYGDPERGKTMYEKLVTSHPKRVDLWSSYADQLTRIGDITATRALYNRISTLGLQAKKMKALFGKWLEFEKVHGTEDQQGEVKRAALQYLNARDVSTPMDA